MKKAKIICRQSDAGYGVTFECSKCGKSLFVNSLCKRTECSRCDAKFKNKIFIKHVKNERR